MAGLELSVWVLGGIFFGGILGHVQRDNHPVLLCGISKNMGEEMPAGSKP